jgi:hypothetical protein
MLVWAPAAQTVTGIRKIKNLQKAKELDIGNSCASHNCTEYEELS